MKIKSLSIALVIGCLSVSVELYAQMELGAATSVQSPNAANLGKFGDIPVSLFTGVPSISIPVTTINNGPIKVPVELQYDASGCRIDQHATWVGLNWTLQAGGVIKRQTNGFFDEYKYSDVFKGYADPECYSSLAAANWNTLDYFNNGPQFADRYPDEFTFNFNGITGSFMLNHEGKWIVRSKENLSLKITEEIQNEFVLPGCNLPLTRVFTKFTIITNDGTTYVFGGDLNAIEFSASSLPSIIPEWNNPPSPPVANIGGYQRNIQTSAWHLTEIIAPTGQRIEFNYARGYTLQQATYSEVSCMYRIGGLGLSKTYDINQANKFAVFTSYLESITANDIVCTFSRSVSNELPQDFKLKPVTRDRFVFTVGLSTLMQYFKLDGIEIKVNNVPVKKYALAYIEKPTERLKLKELKSVSAADGQIEFSYKMEYNSLLLPDYNSGLEDHWGFYNGTNFFGNMFIESNLQNYPNVTDYYQSREPHPVLMGAEIIRKLIYPTGGYSEFYFEPHEYAAVVKQDPSIFLQTLSVNKIAGGLRIKMIKTFDALNSTPKVQEYFYVKDYNTGGTISSGILAGEPKYYEEYTIPNFSEPYKKFSSLPLNYLNTTNGNHITYTQVTEKKSEGYSIYTYNNFDNGYLDKPAFVQMVQSPSSNYFKKLYGKLDLERGLLRSTKIYASDNVLEKEIANEYNQDPNRYNVYVRAIHNYSMESGGASNMSAFPIYTFYPYRTRELTATYCRNGITISSEVNYTYDPVHQLLRTATSINSNGVMKRSTFIYPPDYVSMPAAPAANEVHDIEALKASNIVNTPIETIQSVLRGGNEFVVGGKLMHFENLKPERDFELETEAPIAVSNFSRAAITSQGFTADSRYKERNYYSRFDDKGNVQEIIAKDNFPACYLWGYNKTYPVAKITNATYNEVATVIGTTAINNLMLSYNDADIRSIIQQLRVGLPKAQVYTYTFKPFIGLSSETAPNNYVTTFQYDNFGQLYLSRDDNGNVVKRYDYGYMELKRISLSHSSLNFGNVPMGHSASQTLLVNNTGTLPVIISNLTLPAGYTYIINGSGTIPPGDNVSITITFTPTAVNVYAGNVSIVSDAPGSNSIAVTGAGVGTKIISVTGNLAFGTTNSSTMSFPCRNLTMTITNSGTLPLTVTNVITPHPFGKNWSGGTIPPGGSQNVTISFCPVVPGTFSGTITVVSDKTDGTETIGVSGSAVRL